MSISVPEWLGSLQDFMVAWVSHSNQIQFTSVIDHLAIFLIVPPWTSTRSTRCFFSSQPLLCCYRKFLLLGCRDRPWLVKVEECIHQFHPSSFGISGKRMENCSDHWPATPLRWPPFCVAPCCHFESQQDLSTGCGLLKKRWPCCNENGSEMGCCPPKAEENVNGTGTVKTPGRWSLQTSHVNIS